MTASYAEERKIDCRRAFTFTDTCTNASRQRDGLHGAILTYLLGASEQATSRARDEHGSHCFS